MTEEEKAKGGRPRRLDPEKDPPNRRRGTATTFGHAVALTGMTIPEAARFLDISVPSARAYSLGTRVAPPRVLDRMADLWMRMMTRADPGELPDAVSDRRQAVLDLRSRAWSQKAVLTEADLEGKADTKTAMAWAKHLAAGKAKAGGAEEEDEEEDDA